MEAATPPPAAGMTADYPVRFDVEYPDRLSHWKVLLEVFVSRFPQFIVVYLLQIVFSVMVLIAFFAILFTARWPQGMWDFGVQVQRWSANVVVYGVLLMRDEYPPFSGEPGQYPVTFELEQPERLSRLLIFVKWLLIIPHVIVLTFLFIAGAVVGLIAFFAILFTGRYPRGMFDFLVGVIRWTLRVNAYGQWLMTDRYPPFSLR